MSYYLTNGLYVFAIVSAGMIAGIYFIFSNTVMPTLASMETTTAANTMKLINRIILNPLFFSLFMGSALASLAIVVQTFIGVGHQSSYIGGGAALLLIASFILTLLFNVPLNNLLDASDIHSIAADETWSHYLDNWVFWNHVRTWVTFLASLLFTVELMI